ncbi:MAG: ribosomal protein small subunit ribosomal protein [Candidatus Parcubacteria bacterium]|jgi:small subunit ribosomal protein S5
MSEVATTTQNATQAEGQTSEFRPRSRAPFRKNKRRVAKRRERVRSEFEQKILAIRRVTRVSSGGRRFTFSVAIVVGDKKGRVGVATGKAGDTSLAIDKAARAAKKNAITINTNSEMSIPHEVQAKYCSGVVKLMPAKGRGIIAGSAVRDIIILAGLKDINAKILSGSKNKLNIAQATIKALSTLKKARGQKATKLAATK